MKIDLGTVILNGDGSEATNAKEEPLTVREIARASLLGSPTEDAQKKYENFCLFEKIKPIGIIELTIAETKTIMDAVGALQPTLVMGQVWKLLESAKIEEETKPAKKGK